jgi:hypothetical protein
LYNFFYNNHIQSSSLKLSFENFSRRKRYTLGRTWTHATMHSTICNSIMCATDLQITLSLSQFTFILIKFHIVNKKCKVLKQNVPCMTWHNVTKKSWQVQYSCWKFIWSSGLQNFQTRQKIIKTSIIPMFLCSSNHFSWWSCRVFGEQNQILLDTQVRFRSLSVKHHRALWFSDGNYKNLRRQYPNAFDLNYENLYRLCPFWPIMI